MRVFALGGLAAGAVVVSGATARAQSCTPGWLPGDGIPGVNNTPFASTTWDPDGPGPESELLVLGGMFTFAGEVPAQNIAAWDGQRWRAMSLPQSSFVYSFGRFSGELIAGSSVGAWRWDGQAWQHLGAAGPGQVDTMAEFQGKLYAGGSFSSLATNCRLARWDGVAWEAVPDGPVHTNPAVATTKALLVDGNTLLLGGLFTSIGGGQPIKNIARYDGVSWSAVGAPDALTGTVRALAFYNGEVHAAGQFSVTGGSPADQFFARFDGQSWIGIPGLTTSYASAMVVLGNELIVAGAFGSAAGPSVVRWNGTQFLSTGGSASPINTIAVHDGHLVVAGTIGLIGEGGVYNVARWEGGTQWSALGTGFNAPVTALAEFNGELIAGGSFRRAGRDSVGGVARLTASGWAPIGGAFNSLIDALAAIDGALYVGGSFTLLDGAPITNVARWNGSQWESLGSVALGRDVLALGSFGGELYAAGSFLTSTGPARRVARWTGSSWAQVGAGLGGPNFGEYIYGLTPFGTELVAVGRFNALQTTPGSWSVAHWDGAAWQPFGSGLGVSTNYAGYAAAVYNGVLHVGGMFDSGGANPTLRNIAKWDGSQWLPVGGTANGAVQALAVHDGRLYAGGAFTTIGGVIASRMAAWDGSAWSPVDGGLDGTATVMLPRQGELAVGGQFLQAGGRASSFLARLACEPCYANCDGSTALPVLNVNDFLCFQSRFAAADPYANCDGSSVPPVLNVNDFLCFMGEFAAGCS
jgi:hypothetical protein